MNDTKATNSTVDGEVNYKEDLFCWTIEGVGILVIGLIGVFGNSCSMVLFSRQKVHRIFHHLLLLLSFFDLVSIYHRKYFHYLLEIKPFGLEFQNSRCLFTEFPNFNHFGPTDGRTDGAAHIVVQMLNIIRALVNLSCQVVGQLRPCKCIKA